MLEKLENEPFFRIWLEKVESHRFSPSLAGKAGILFLGVMIIIGSIR